MLPRVSLINCDEVDYMLFSTHDPISNALFKSGVWEDYLITISRVLLSGTEHPFVLDIGANLGAYSIPMSKYLQTFGGGAYCFEPQRIVYYQLCGNIILNRLDNCHAFHCAVGSRDGVVSIPEVDYENNVNIGAFSLNKVFREMHGIERAMRDKTRKVKVVCLDNFEFDESPSLLKIDVEGLELDVLKGAVGFLERYHYPPILFEAWGFDWFQGERAELLSFISHLGYQTITFGTFDYLAQHPAHGPRVELIPGDRGAVNVVRVR